MNSSLFFDMSYGIRHPYHSGGKYRITGYADRLGMPGPYKVRLHERIGGRVIAETWSDDAGFYQFDNLKMVDGGYYAVAFDHSSTQKNAGIADSITPG